MDFHDLVKTDRGSIQIGSRIVKDLVAWLKQLGQCVELVAFFNVSSGIIYFDVAIFYDRDFLPVFSKFFILAGWLKWPS
ncbi:MAG: hypothetical protein POG74_05300 [Acidocella sp.]|nr:hypothetical protein [Acidocella sp.]